MSKVIVLGGMGFIGHKVCCQLRDAGHAVHIIDIETNYDYFEHTFHAENLATRSQLMGDLSVRKVDVRDRDQIRQIFERVRPSKVIHLANIPVAGISFDRPVFANDQIVGGTLTLLDAALATGVDRFVYVSSSMVYGDFLADKIDETHPCEPREIYGALKLNAERMVRLYTDLHGLPHTIIRPIAVYGPTGNDAFVINKFMRAAVTGGSVQVLGKETSLDFTFVDDAARGIVLAALSDHSENETFNIAGGKSNRLLDAAYYLKTKEPELSIAIKQRDELYPARGALDISKAQSLIGYTPGFTFEEGLDAHYEFAKDTFSPVGSRL